MSIERYRALMEQLAAWCTVDQANSGAQVVHLSAFGASFGLYYGGVLAPESLLVHCEFGDVPEFLHDRILQRLLEMNTYLFSIRNSTFSFDAGSDRIVLICRFDLAQASRMMLMDVFEDIAGMAQQWRRDYFLPGPAESLSRKQ